MSKKTFKINDKTKLQDSKVINNDENNRRAALDIHIGGKISTGLTKNIENQKDLSLLYSPWVAEPCKEIFADINKVWDYTVKSNTVLVVSNGTAVLGLGNIGAAAAIPVLEGKAALFKRFGGVNAVSLAVDELDPDKLINLISKIATNYGGINLEDIKAPECFYIEEELSKKLNIPVFHDDQHGTAIVILSGLINAAKVFNKKIEKLKVIINGAGAGGIATARLLRKFGIQDIILCDSRGPIYEGRGNSNSYKDEFLYKNKISFDSAIAGRDVFIGLSVGNILTKDMICSLNANAIVFALANPDPEILPNIAKSYRDDIIVATGRSDFENQINNVLCFPYLFAGLLKYRINKIDDNLKIILAKAIADFAYQLDGFGINKIVPSIFDKEIYNYIIKQFDILFKK